MTQKMLTKTIEPQDDRKYKHALHKQAKHKPHPVRAEGLSRIAALNVLARKMVRVAFGLFKSNQHFDPSKIAIA
jgi:hypothetical protein